MSTTIYGIVNCDSVKKARRWLTERDIEHRFHDLRADGLDRQLLDHWLDSLGWEALLNRRSSSWKALSAAEREAMDRGRAAAAVLAAPTLVKRPLLDCGGHLEVGFSERRYAELFRR